MQRRLSLSSILTIANQSAGSVKTSRLLLERNFMEHADHYFRGDACKWTGEAEEHYNGFFYVYTIIEGHRAGERILSQEKPRSQRKEG